MPINTQQLHNGRVYLYTYSPDFTVAEIGETVDILQRDVLPYTTKKIHTITDFSAVRSLPPNSLGSSRHLAKRSHPMLGTVILVTPNDFIRRMINIMVKITPSATLISFKTLDEALAEADRLLALEAQEVVPSTESSEPAQLD